MKFSILTVAVATLATTAQAANCVRQVNSLYHYVVKASGVGDISGICGGLWDNLQQFSACSASSTSCGAIGDGNELVWSLSVPNSCNGGMVEATWWDATRNQWGDIDCP